MKKIICILIALICIISFAYAEYDFSTMTDSEIQDLIVNAQNELKKRADKKDKIIFEENDIKVCIKGRKIRQIMSPGEYVLDLEFDLENNSSHDVTMDVPDSSINGWETGSASCYAGSGGFDFTVRKGKKGKGVICFRLEGTDVKNYADIEKIEFTLGIWYDGASTWYNPPILSKEVSLEFIDGAITNFE